MNYAMLFLVPSALANTSYEARKIALNAMTTGVVIDALEKNHSDSDDVNWYDSCCIGGLWSGYFSKLFLKKNKLKAFADEVQETYGWPIEKTFISFSKVNPTIDEKREKALKIFLKYFPDFQGEPPFFRNECFDLGYPDDALFIDDQHKYDILLHNYEGESIVADPLDKIKLFSLSEVEISPENIIGSHWAVIIACHC